MKGRTFKRSTVAAIRRALVRAAAGAWVVSLLSMPGCGRSEAPPPLPIVAGSGARAVDAYFIRYPTASPDQIDGDGNTSLHVAIHLHDARTVLALLHHRPNLEQKDARGRTPLYFASAMGYVEEVGALLIAGADPRSRNGEEDDTPLHAAALAAPLGVSETLLAHGADANQKNAWGQSPLFFAARAAWVHSEEVTALLLGHQADVTIADERGFTALHAAAAHDNYRAIRFLLAAYADAAAVTHQHNTPLDVALEQHCDLAAEALFEAGAPRGKSVLPPPLFQAAAADDQDWVLHILSFGFQRDLSVDGKTAADVARAANAGDALALLTDRAR